MKLCPVCQTEYADEVRFCPNDGQTLRSSSPGTDLVGQVLADRYHVVRKLGEGGMGQVYLAEHVKMGRKSAIKVMNPSMVHDPDALARFNREAANASRISHPNVCAVYDFGETAEGLVYLAMEFIEGEPLTDLLLREQALPALRAGAIFLQVADALQAAHDLGIVHRDLKPDNIMLAHARDGADVVKVVDFGIAKAVGGDDAQKVTRTGLVVGTPEFMSPEQLSGDKVDGRSDLYSLALVLFKMLTGVLPFSGTTVQETMVQRLTTAPAKLADVRPDLRFPAGLQGALDLAFARQPAERYQTVAKFAGDVGALLGLQRGARVGAIPATRPDADAKTELVRRSAGTPSGGPPRGRRLTPIVAGAAVLLGGAGAAALYRANSRKARVLVAGADSTRPAGAARGDSLPAAPQPSSRASDAASGARRQPAPQRPVERSTRDALYVLFDRLDSTTARTVLDSAQVLFNAAGITPPDQALAAFVTGNAYFQLADKKKGCVWVHRATQLAPTDTLYPKIAAQCGS
ncbi:MAG TPA: serine/threonine-protein kinase [Gemmatimonadales bacterium]|nr:serine/threonine-protein kinase [Gemmatimonadales bacterium]